MMGFALDPTLSVGYTSIDYQFYLRSDATADVYEKATRVGIGVPPYTTDTLFEIIYDGSEVRYLMDGVVKRTVTGLDFNLSFCLDSSFYSAGSKATHVQWGPYSPPLSVVQARAELARTTAQSYADGEITAAEQRAIAEAQAKADLAEANANAYADGKVTVAEQRAIDAAQAKADLAEMNAKAWADGIVTAEEQRAIQDAQAKADAAELAAKEYADTIVLSAEQRAALDAQAKATVAETTAKAYADGQVTAAEQRAIADAQSKALMGHNLLNWYESWVPGTGSTGQFLRNSTDAENMRALAVGPFGQREIVWQSIPSGDGSADGGFNTLAPTGGFSVDPDKTYIYGCYMQRLTGNGTIYLGCSQVKNLSGVVISNPYFTSTSLLNDAKWMLAIGVIHPRGYTGPDTGMSGFYDVETGVKLVAGSDFKIDDTLADPTVQRMRAFQYNSTTGNGVTVEAQFARPFVMEASVCPPIDQLTGKLSTIAAGADVTDYSTIYANTETFPAVLTPDVMKRTGSTFEKTGGVAGWNAQAYSLQGYTGGCRLAFKAGVTTLNFMAGINTDPATDASYTSVDYQFQCMSTGLVTTYQGATLFSIGGPSYTTDTLFEIIYDGSEIRFLMDGVTKRTVTGLDMGLTFYMDLSFSNVGSKATHVQWGPYAPPLSVVKALALAAETEAKSFADGIVTAEEQRAIADAQAKANAAQAAAQAYTEGWSVQGADVTNYDDPRVSNVKTENNVTTIARPVGGTYYNSGASVTGAIKITLPQSWSNTLMKFGVDVRQYSTTKSFTLHLGGYNYSTTTRWINSFAQLAGSTASNNRVRFGHDGTKCCILIGDVTSVWNYPSVVVKDFQASYASYTRDKWETGWAISIVTDISGITTTADIADTLIDAKSILGQGALATQNTADYGTQVTGTKPPANADSTTTVIGAGLITTGYIGNKGKTDPLLTLGINFDTAEILVGAAAGLRVKSGGGILVESGGGITVKDGGAVSIEAGGDLVLTANSTNPSTIIFSRSPTDDNPMVISGGVDDVYDPFIKIAPTLSKSASLYLGYPTSRMNTVWMYALAVRISAVPYGASSQVGIAAAGENEGIDGGYVNVDAIQSVASYAWCRCSAMGGTGYAHLWSSHKTQVKSDALVEITAPDITISGSTVKGVPIYAPYRKTAPTTAELPNNHYIIYRISATGIRFSMNCDGSIQTRSLL